MIFQALEQELFYLLKINVFIKESIDLGFKLMSKLMKIDFEDFQHLHDEAAQGESQSSFQKASVHYDFIFFRVWASFFPFVGPHNGQIPEIPSSHIDKMILFDS